MPKTVYEERVVSLRVGDEAELEALAKELTGLGYRREEMVEGAGQFSHPGRHIGYLSLRGCAGQPGPDRFI